MHIFFEHGLGLVDVKLGLEVSDVAGKGRAVGATAGIGKLKCGRVIMGLFADGAPVALAITVLLGLSGIRVGKAVLGEELGEVVVGDVALGHVTTAAVVVLVGASHDDGWMCDDMLMKMKIKEEMKGKKREENR